MLKHRRRISLRKNNGLVNFKINSCVRGHDWVGGHGPSPVTSKRVDIEITEKQFVELLEPTFGNSDEINVNAFTEMMNKIFNPNKFYYVENSKKTLLKVLVPKIIERILKKHDYTSINKIINFSLTHYIKTHELFDSDYLLELFATIQYTDKTIFTNPYTPDTDHLVLKFKAKDNTDKPIKFKLNILDAIYKIDSFLEPFDTPWKSKNNIPERKIILLRLVLSNIDLFKCAIGKGKVFRYICYLEIHDIDYRNISILYSDCDETTRTQFENEIKNRLKYLITETKYIITYTDYILRLEKIIQYISPDKKLKKERRDSLISTYS